MEDYEATGVVRAFSHEYVATRLSRATKEIYAADPRVRSVGVGLCGGGYGFVAVRNTEAGLPSGTEVRTIERYAEIPVRFIDTMGDPESLSTVIHAGPPQASNVPEQGRHRPLVCGLEVQNFDDDLRTGLLGKSQMSVGTIGCFVRLKNGDDAFLSNNHVVAGENRGVRGKDRILQSGALTISPDEQAGVLSDFLRLRVSKPNAHPPTARMNIVDAGWVKVTTEKGWRQEYLPSRKVPAPQKTAKPKVGYKVFKVGRRTGLTWGIVSRTPAIVGPVQYSSGPCWFRRAMVIESRDESAFSDKGDSGSVIVRDDDTGTVIGLLFAGYGGQTYACPIEDVLAELECKLL